MPDIRVTEVSSTFVTRDAAEFSCSSAPQEKDEHACGLRKRTRIVKYCQHTCVLQISRKNVNRLPRGLAGGNCGNSTSCVLCPCRWCRTSHTGQHPSEPRIRGTWEDSACHTGARVCLWLSSTCNTLALKVSLRAQDQTPQQSKRHAIQVQCSTLLAFGGVLAFSALPSCLCAFSVTASRRSRMVSPNCEETRRLLD